MKYYKMWMLIFFFLNIGMLQGFDDLFVKKLKHIEQFEPKKHWPYLAFDDSFVLDFTDPESFIKRATCLKIKDGRLYILDNNRHRLLIFDRKGRFIKKVGRIGRGPGDIYYPYWMDICKNDVYILNNNGLDIFGKGLKFVDRIRSFLSIHKFSIDGNYLYCGITGAFKDKYPLFLKLNMRGGVEEAVYSEDLEDTLFQISKDGNILTFNDQVVFVSRHWNRIYFYDKKSKLLKRIKIEYDLLDKIEEWNQRNVNRKHRHITWFSNMIASAKQYQEKIYLLLKIPRLEIISIDTEGNIQEHFFNDEDSRFMRWYDFAIEEKGGRRFFYVMGFSIGEEKKRDLTEFSVHRLVIPDARR